MSQSAPASPTPDAPATALSPPLTVHVEVTDAAGAPRLTATTVPENGSTAVSDGDTGLVVTASTPDAGEPLVRLVFGSPAGTTAPTGTTVTLAPDDTGAVVTAAGDLVAGFAAPLVVDGAGTPLKASWQSADPATADGFLAVDLVLDSGASTGTSTGATSGPVTVTLHLGTTVVAATAWGDREGGESLAVTPSAWGRVSGQTGYALGWADVVRLEPDADTSVMEKQFRCHQLGAPDKATWNLEPWRPDVSYLAYVAARCNPV